MIQLDDNLRAEYAGLFSSCVIRPERSTMVDIAVNSLLANRPRYEAVGSPLGIPWQFIACIHSMESGQNFARHLHNGDPLNARTVHVPAGRPIGGEPPFTWEQSAADALALKGLAAVTDWALPGMLYQMERYNGFGYRMAHPDVLTPYLWSWSNHYTAGKYVADGKFDVTAVSAQCGAAVLLRRLGALEGVVLPEGQFAPPSLIAAPSEPAADDLNAAEMARIQASKAK